MSLNYCDYSAGSSIPRLQFQHSIGTRGLQVKVDKNKLNYSNEKFIRLINSGAALLGTGSLSVI
jgi:hypothetical protein